jgi:hypothetical protein
MADEINGLLALNRDQRKEIKQYSKAYDSLVKEIQYLKLREKKIMYLVNMLQGRGYPVNSIFEQHVKPVDTMRFQEFLDAEKFE